MGGIRGVMHYMQRSALQGHPSFLTKVTQQYLPGAKQKEDLIHPFRKYFDDGRKWSGLIPCSISLSFAWLIDEFGLDLDFLVLLAPDLDICQCCFPCWLRR